MGKELKRVGKQVEGLGKGVFEAVGLRDRDEPAPAAEPKMAMPDADDEAVKAARRRRLAESKRRGGRDSTILAGDDLLGG